MACCSCPASSTPRPTSSSIRRSWRTASWPSSRRSAIAAASSPASTVASAHSRARSWSRRAWRGRSSARCARGPTSPRAGCGHRRTTMARLTPITSKHQVAPKNQAIVDGIVASRGALQGPFTMFLHCPELAGRLAHLGAFVRFEGSLDMRVRVLAAMTVARELDAIYVWGAQTGQARKLGVPATTIAAVREKHARGLPPEDAQIVEFTRALLRQHRVDDATVKALRARFGDDGFIQLTGAIGYYSMLAMTVNACELEAAPGAEVLQPGGGS